MPPARFPLDETPGGLEAKQTIGDALAKMHNGKPPFPWIEDDGSALLGCYAPLSYSPQVARQFFEVAKTVYTEGAVKVRNRELAILGLASVLNVPYVAFCHRGVGAKVHLTAEQCDEGLAGKVPQGLSEVEELAYRLGRTLATLNGPLDQQTFEEIVSKMSKAEFVGIVHTIAGYRWIALLEHVNADSRWD